MVTALLLRVDEIIADSEGRPARSDRTAPQFDRRPPRPVGVDSDAATGTVALRSAKARPARVNFRFSWSSLFGSIPGCRSRRGSYRLVAGLSQEAFLGSLRPPPM